MDATGVAKQLNAWSSNINNKGKPQEINEMVALGKKAVKELGENPSHYTTAFTKFQQANRGQYVSKNK